MKLFKTISKMFGNQDTQDTQQHEFEPYTEYELGISRKHSNAKYIGLEVCSGTHTYEFGKHAMSVQYIDFWANDKQLKKVIKNLSKYDNLEYTINKKEEL